jgi:ribosomal protein S18 acetylase RimI-like enzyme
VPKYVRVDAYEYRTGNHRLYARCGFAPVRYFEELLRPLTDLPEVRVPAGVVVVPWPDDRDEEVRLVKNTTFADHWGSTPMAPDRWHQLVRGFGGRPDLSFVALDEVGAVVAFCLNKRYEADDEVLGRRDGWIDNLGTLPQWRGRGVASALVAASLRAFADAGLTHASIGVDAESLTGASKLYRSLGFELQQRSITYQIEVR